MLHGQAGYDSLSRCLDDALRELLKLVNAKRNSAAPASYDSYVAP